MRSPSSPDVRPIRENGRFLPVSQCFWSIVAFPICGEALRIVHAHLDTVMDGLIGILKHLRCVRAVRREPMIVARITSFVAYTEAQVVDKIVIAVRFAWVKNGSAGRFPKPLSSNLRTSSLSAVPRRWKPKQSDI